MTNKCNFYNVNSIAFQRMVSPSKRLQHLQFQNYLKQKKETVLQNLRITIFPSLSYEDYNFLRVVGKGNYGKVVTAQNIHNQNIYAVKIINKKNLVKREILRHLISEVRILKSVDFEFLISLEHYFTNKCAVFLVMPYISGGHFLGLLRKTKKLDEDMARFFAGQIVLAFEYLHYMGIVYRDLKPENLLLDLTGYLKIIDYGFTKHIGSKYTYTLCGTPEYIAPEILLNKGYTLSPDWWTLGILLYEMCNERPPFTSRNELKLFEKIIFGKIKWPVHFSKELKSLVEGLLQVDTTKRLGCMKKKVEDIKFHSWFSSLDWIALWNKQIPSPVSTSQDEYFEENYSNSFANCKNHITNEMIGNIDFAI